MSSLVATTDSLSPATSGAAAERKELGEFLRSRRARIRPQAVGLPGGTRRRTPGLRREEVAQLAGVGVTWYTWLEQGRPINASVQVVDAIARALRLDRHERRHLHTLAGLGDAALPPMECAVVGETERAVLRQLMPFPTVVLNGRYDILAFNTAYGKLLVDLDQVPDEDRNTLVLGFTYDEWRQGVRNWDAAAPRMIASFRAAMAQHLDDPLWTGLVDRLRSESTLFDQLWRRHDVAPMSMRDKQVRSPDVGDLNLRSTSLGVVWAPGSRVVIYVPSDDVTRRRLEQLQELCEA